MPASCASHGIRSAARAVRAARGAFAGRARGRARYRAPWGAAYGRRRHRTGFAGHGRTGQSSRRASSSASSAGNPSSARVRVRASVSAKTRSASLKRWIKFRDPRGDVAQIADEGEIGGRGRVARLTLDSNECVNASSLVQGGQARCERAPRGSASTPGCDWQVSRLPIDRIQNGPAKLTSAFDYCSCFA